MKKLCAAVLALLLVLTISGALAESTMVKRSGSLAAYLDGKGGLYLPGNDKAVNQAPAKTIVSIDAYRLLFLSETTDDSKDLYMIDLGDFSERLVADGVYAAALEAEDALWYVSDEDRTQLMRMDLGTMTAKPAFKAAEPIDRLQLTAEGLVVVLVDDAGALVHVDMTDSFESYLNAVPRNILLTDAYVLELADGELTLRDRVSTAAESVDTGVQDYAVLNGMVYYLCNTRSAVRLKGYVPAAMTWQVVLTLDPSMERQLASTGGQLFMLDQSRQIYTISFEHNELRPFAKVGPDANYALPQGQEISALRLEGMDGQLNVYGELQDASAQPDFSFIEFTSSSDDLAPEMVLLEHFVVEGEAPAWTALKPAVQYSPLSRGSRGDAVRAIQQPLYDLGYYDYYVDGIFGPRTEQAVRLLQADVNRPVTGVADAELQRLILGGKLPHYDAYMALTRGNRGLRVQMMQEALRDLGYLADAADGIFGSNTQRAVQLFQSENGLTVSDGATRETLKVLYSDDASRCASYIDLYPGYTGYRVRELNNRLRELYYLSSNPGSVYTQDTAEAVKAYQRRAGLKVTGNATTDVLAKLFSKYAPEAPGYITLRRGDDNDRVKTLQRRLKTLNYYTGTVDGYYGRATEKAVELFQKNVDITVTGVANVRTQQLLFSKDAPEYVKPTVIGKPVITLDCWHHRDDDVFFITDDSTDTGYITFRWYVEGEAESFRVQIEDEDGYTYVDEDTLLSRTRVSLYTLEYDELYTLTITAYPEDGNKKHITSSSIDFMRVEEADEPEEPEVAEIGDPEIAIETVNSIEGGVQYVAPGKVVLHWHADGDVDYYEVEVLDEDGDTWLSQTTQAEKLSFKSSDMTVGEVYTLFVYAIPENGTIDDATVEAEFFALEDVSIPKSMEPDEDDEADEADADDGETEGGETEKAEDEETGEAEGGETVADGGDDAPEAEDETDEETETELVEKSVEGPVVPLEPVVGAVEESHVTAPELSFETVVAEADGIVYLADDKVIMNWASEGDVEGYYAEIADSQGNVLAHATTDKQVLAIKQGNLQPGEVYTLTVTAIPAGGSVEDGASDSAKLALYAEVAGAVEETAEETYAAEETEEPEPVKDAPAQEEPVKQEPVEEAPVQEEAPKEAQTPEYETDYEEAYEEEYGDSEEAYSEEDYEESDYEEDDAEDYAEDYAEDEPEAAEAPEEASAADPWSEALTPDSDSGLIAQVQKKLISLGFLDSGDCDSGVLDEATLQAVRDFQSWYNDNQGGELSPAGGSVSVATLGALMG